MSRQENLDQGAVLRGRPLAEKFTAAAWAILGGVLPVLMVPSNRSSTACIVIAALCCLIAIAISGQWRPFAGRLRAMLATWEGLAAVVFALWCAISIGWSPVPKASWFAYGETALPVLATLVLAAGLGRPPLWLPMCLLAALTITLLGLVLELQDGALLRWLYRGRPFAFVLNRPTVVALLVAVPLFEMLLMAGRRWLSAGIFILLCVVLVVTASHSAKFGMIAAIVAIIGTRFMPRLAPWLGMAAVLLLLAIAPHIGDIARAVLPAHALDTVEEGHPRERVLIWETFGEVARDRPLQGIGFNGSPNADKSPVASEISPERREILRWGHPHNVFLQVWAEMGLVGVVLTAIGIVLLFRRLSRVPVTVLPYRMGAVAAIAAIGIVSHGAWQGWWFAAIGAEILLFLASSRLNETLDRP